MAPARSTHLVASPQGSASRRARFAALSLVAVAAVAALGAGPATAGASEDQEARRARFEAVWEAQDPNDPLTWVTSPLPGI